MKILVLVTWGFLFLTAPLYCLNSHLDLFIDEQACGGKLILPCTEFRYSQSLKQEEINFGLAWSSEKVIKQLPFSIKCGDLSAGGLYSKLKNPLLTSSVSPFSTPVTEAACLTTTLPSYTSFSKETGCFFEAGYKNKKTTLQEFKINYYVSPQDALEVVSSKIKLALANKLNVSSSVCAGYFEYSNNESNSWFIDEQYYMDGIHFCTGSQFAISTPGISSVFSLFLYESPFGYYQEVYRLENKLKTTHFIYSLNSAYVPQKLITSSNKVLAEQLQLKGGLQYQFITGHSFPVFVKTGVNTFANINLREEEHDLKFGAGVALSSPFYSLSITAALNNSVKMSGAGSTQVHFENGSIKLKNSWYFNIFTPTLAASFSYNPSADYTSFTTLQGYELNLAVDSNPNIVLKNKVTLSHKNFINTGKNYTASVSLKTRIKWLTVSGKFSIKFEF